MHLLKIFVLKIFQADSFFLTKTLGDHLWQGGPSMVAKIAVDGPGDHLQQETNCSGMTVYKCQNVHDILKVHGSYHKPWYNGS